jgi:hypothetical protein
MIGTLGWKQAFANDSLDYNDNRLPSGILGLPTQLQDELGIVRWEIDSTYGMCGYKLVKNNSGAGGGALAQGDVCTYNDANFLNVTTDYDETGTNRNFIAGMCIGKNGISVGNYGWLQVYGQPHSTAGVAIPFNITGGVTPAAGDALIQAGADKVVDKTTAGTAPTYRPFAYATGAASGAGGTIPGFLVVITP